MIQYGKWSDEAIMTEETFAESVFMSEWLATNRATNQLVISAVCNSSCIFCSNRMNPFPIDKGFFRDVEDIKQQLSLMAQHGDPISLSDTLPGRISEGEAFLHPELFQILDLVRRKYVFNKLRVTTNGSMLDEPFVKKLARYRPMEINVSLHSTRPDHWSHIFGRSEREAQVALGSLELLKKYQLDLLGTIVPLPEICGWDELALTFSTLVSHGAQEVILYWPGYTRITPEQVRRQLRCPWEEFVDFADRMRTDHGVSVAAYPDADLVHGVPVEHIMASTLRGNPETNWGPFQQVLWLTSAAAYEQLRSLVGKQEVSTTNQHCVFPVENSTYGGNINVAGLLMVEDFIHGASTALKRWPNVDLVLVPSLPFDALRRDLRRTPAFKMSEAIGKPVWLVDDDGHHDPLLDRVLSRKEDTDWGRIKAVVEHFTSAFERQGDPDAGLGLVAAFPIQTATGLMAREQFRQACLAMTARLAQHAKPAETRIEVLDDTSALCIQKWWTRDEGGLLKRWILLTKRDSEWRIESVRWGK